MTLSQDTSKMSPEELSMIKVYEEMATALTGADTNTFLFPFRKFTPTKLAILCSVSLFCVTGDIMIWVQRAVSNRRQNSPIL